MPPIEAGAGVKIDLPDQPTPLARLEPTLTEAWRDYSTRTLIADPDPGAALWRAGINWWSLLYRLWREDKIEPWGRHGAPDAELAQIKELIRGGWLSPVRTFVPARRVDTARLHVRAGEFIPEEAAAAASTQAIVGDVIEHYAGAPTISPRSASVRRSRTPNSSPPNSAPRVIAPIACMAGCRRTNATI